MRRNWFVQWLKGCARLWKMYWENRPSRRVHLTLLPSEEARPWPPPDSHPDFGNATVAKAHLVAQDRNLPQIVGDAIFGVVGSRPTRGIKAVVMYEDGTELTVYERLGHVLVYLEPQRLLDGNDAIIVEHRPTVALAEGA